MHLITVMRCAAILLDERLDQFGKAPLHERIKPLGWLRTPLRKAFFGFLRKVSGTPEARALAAETLRGSETPANVAAPAIPLTFRKFLRSCFIVASLM